MQDPRRFPVMPQPLIHAGEVVACQVKVSGILGRMRPPERFMRPHSKSWVIAKTALRKPKTMNASMVTITMKPPT